MPDRHPNGRQCGIWAPIALALLPYALLRYGIDTWRDRRRKAKPTR